MVMWFYGRKFVTVCDHSSKFGSHEHCASGDVFFKFVMQSHKTTSEKNHVTTCLGASDSK